MAPSSSPPLAETSTPPGAERTAESQVQDMNAEQALALIGMGLVRKMMTEGDGGAWLWMGEEPSAAVDASSLRQRLELVDLAVRTAAPLTTAEVTHLLGARPGAPLVERGGLLARRQGRNVWILSRSREGGPASGAHFQETPRRRF